LPGPPDTWEFSSPVNLQRSLICQKWCAIFIEFGERERERDPSREDVEPVESEDDL